MAVLKNNGFEVARLTRVRTVKDTGDLGDLEMLVSVRSNGRLLRKMRWTGRGEWHGWKLWKRLKPGYTPEQLIESMVTKHGWTRL